MLPTRDHIISGTWFESREDILNMMVHMCFIYNGVAYNNGRKAGRRACISEESTLKGIEVSDLQLT